MHNVHKKRKKHINHNMLKASTKIQLQLKPLPNLCKKFKSDIVK